VVQAIGQPVALLGHSGGGQTVAQVAEAVPDQIAVLVYLAGMMLPSGQTYAEFVQRAAVDQPALAGAGIGRHLDWLDGGRVSQVQPDGARRLFLHDVEPDAAQAAVALLRPQPETGRQMRNQLSAERFGRVPRVYLGCLQDRSLLWPLQQRMQQLTPGALALTLDCGHVPQLAQPAALTALLLPALAPHMP
jgi:pimeloyl-ACP methyl ester carboxylesterase